MSINLSSNTAAERVDLRTRANLAFSNLLYLLGLSLIVLVPGADAGTVAISFTVVAALGLLRIVRRVASLRRAKDKAWKQRDTVRRLAWTFIAVGAADVSWDLLVRERDEAHRPS